MSRFSWDWGFAISILPALLEGLAITVFATAIAAAIALSLGLALLVVRVARIPLVSAGVSFVVEFLRGTPFLVQLYFVFYVLPTYGVTLSPLTTGILALGIYGAARASELYRAGLASIPAGQWEASLVLGLPIPRVWTGVVLPQVAPIVLPMLGNLVIVMFKDTALLSTITVLELVAHARDAGMNTFRFLEPLTMAGFLFWVVSYTAAHVIRALERRHAH